VIQSLAPHPNSPACVDAWHIQCQIKSNQEYLALFYQIRGNMTQLGIPKQQGETHRLDHLWQETCCEVFLRRQDQRARYIEFNLAPSGDWALYRLRGYRAALERPDVKARPIITTDIGSEELLVEAKIPWPMIMDQLPGSSPLEAGISVVLKEKSGVMTYWAVKHPAEKPDFHHPESFFTL